MKKALLVIDVQNDYLQNGKLPLWNVDVTLDNIEKAIHLARKQSIPVILIQQLTDPKVASMFNVGTDGAEIHPRILLAADGAPVVTKGHADSFYQTRLEEVLSALGVNTLLVCGMMTQNCVTHTAISKAADKYEVMILPDCCTTVSAMIHNIGLRAVSTRLSLVSSEDAMK